MASVASAAPDSFHSRRRDPLKPNRHIQLDRVTVPNIGDHPDQRSAEALSSRGGPRERKAGDRGPERAVHDLLTTNAQVEDLDPSYSGTTAMAIVPLSLSPGAEARALLHHLLEHGDVVGKDTVGRTIIQLAVDDWTLEELATFDADAAKLEDQADAEPGSDDEQDGPPVLMLDLARPKMVERRRALTSGCGD
jgi:hypothetical protein